MNTGMDMNHLRKRLISAFLAVMLVCLSVGLTSCSRNNDNKKNPTPANTKTNETEILPAASPATGIGRVMPEVVEPKDWLICIDPGHGFADGGTGPGYLDGLYEKDITIAVANFLKEELEDLGYKVVLTHDGINMPVLGDTNGDSIFSAPYERPGYINNYIAPDYLVSLHVNASDTNPSACGVNVYYWQTGLKNNDWSEEIGQDIVDEINETVETTAVTRLHSPETTADTNFVILGDTYCAASLVEVGFCTNEVDAQNMEDPKWQESIAKAIAAGIDEFFGVRTK